MSRRAVLSKVMPTAGVACKPREAAPGAAGEVDSRESARERQAHGNEWCVNSGLDLFQVFAID